MEGAAPLSARRTSVVLFACVALAGCGAGEAPRAEEAPATPAPTRPAVPAPPTTPSVTRAAYLRALDDYCATTVRTIERLARTPVDERDPVRAIELLARRYRAGLEQLGQVTPPATLRRIHLLTLAQGRESADRIDDGVRLGRAGETDAATTALGELSGLLPDVSRLPSSVRRGAPACAGPGA